MVVLLGLLADRTYRSRTVLIGRYMGFALLVAASLIGALASMVVPTACIGVLGFGPILVGLSKLWAWFRPSSVTTGDGSPGEERDIAPATCSRRREEK
jgi:cadmium resistance protein CadD (predicted permease)